MCYSLHQEPPPYLTLPHVFNLERRNNKKFNITQKVSQHLQNYPLRNAKAAPDWLTAMCARGGGGGTQV